MYFYFFQCRYLSIVKEEGLQISQPALDLNMSEVHHQITKRLSQQRVHRFLFFYVIFFFMSQFISIRINKIWYLSLRTLVIFGIVLTGKYTTRWLVARNVTKTVQSLHVQGRKFYLHFLTCTIMNILNLCNSDLHIQ